MNVEPEFPSLSMQEIRQKVRDLLQELSKKGYDISLRNLVHASLNYRVRELSGKFLLEKQSQEGRDLEEEEIAILRGEFGTTYDGLSPENLIETCRYQYDRATQEGSRARPPFPAESTPEYESLYTIFKELSISLKELHSRLLPSSFGEALKTLSTTPQQVITTCVQHIHEQLERNTSSREKADEVLFWLQDLQRELQERKEQGDSMPENIMDFLRETTENMSRLLEQEDPESALKACAPRYSETGTTLLDQFDDSAR